MKWKVGMLVHVDPLIYIYAFGRCFYLKRHIVQGRYRLLVWMLPGYLTPDPNVVSSSECKLSYWNQLDAFTESD